MQSLLRRFHVILFAKNYIKDNGLSAPRLGVICGDGRKILLRKGVKDVFFQLYVSFSKRIWYNKKDVSYDSRSDAASCSDPAQRSYLIRGE